jgi:phage shock protein PspC (stress-responsive transcriptional regulator)
MDFFFLRIWVCPYCAGIGETFRPLKESLVLYLVGITLLVFLMLSTGIVVYLFRKTLQWEKEKSK